MKARFRQAAVRIGLVLLACWLFSATSVEAAHVQLDMAGVQKLRSAPEPKWVVKWEDERGEREGKHACEAEDSPHESTRWFLRKRRSPAGLVPIEKLMDARARAERMPGGSLSTLPPPRVLLRPVRELTSGKAVPGAIRTFTEASMPPSQPGVASATVNGWSSIGPGNIGGRTRALAAASSSVVYAGGVAGGVWKTTDGGQNWVALDDSMANLAVSCLALDPKDASVVYAGTGEESGSGEGDTNAVRGAGIFKSIDGGAHWNQLASTASKADFYFVNKFAVSLLFGTRLYAATTTGLFASSDGGFSWNRLAASQLTGCITDLVVGQNGSSDVLFVWKRSDGFYVSTDSGATFVARKTGLTPSFQASIAISRTGDRFLALCGARSGTLDGIFTSVDNGATWATLSIPVGSGFDGSFDGQLEYDNICAIDPFNSRRLWVGGVNLFVSNDAGATWAQASRWCAPTVDVPHADQHAIAFSPDYDGTTHQRIFFGNDGGVFATDSGASALPSFRTLNHGYGVTQFYNGAVSATGTVVIGGTQDNGSDGYDSKNPSPNPSFDWNRIFPGDGGYCAIDPTNDNVFYVESQNGELRKTSQGIACQTPDCQFPLCYSSATTGITEGLPFITVFAMDPSNSSRLWLGGTQPWRTINGATSWSSATSGAALHGIDTITAIGIAPSSNGSTVYLGTDGGSVFKSTIALTQAPTWLNISAGLPANSYVSGIAVHPTDSNTLYVTFSGFDVPNGQVWKSMNGGISWLSLRGTGPTAFPNVPCHVVAIDPKDTNTLFAGTDSGVFSSTDAGASWSNVNSPGLANTIVEALVYQQSTDRLFAFTHGRGVFVADVSNVPAPNVGITKIATSLSTVGLGQTFTTTVTLRNFGSAAANFTGEHLSITGSAVTAAELATARSLAAGQTTTFTFTCTGASQGVASITSATITATSAQDGSAAGIRSNAASPVDVTVIRPTPALKIISIASARSIVGVGQSFTATVTVRNDGTGAANLSAGKLTVNPKLLLTPTDTVLSISLAAGGGTASLMLGVTGGPSTGAASITSATLTASSAFDGSSVPIAANLATAASVSVVNAIPSIKIDSISVTRTQLATGQTLGATVKLHNYGTGTANLTAAQLVFAGSNLSAPALALAKSIAPAADLPLDFVVTGNSAGSSSITSLTLAATNAFTGLPVGIAGNNAQSKNVLVQELAGLVVDSVTLSSARVHRGQIGALARVVLRNPAPAATGGTAIFIAGALRIGTSNGGYTVSRLVAAPDTLAAGRSASMSYAIDVLDTAALGLTNVTADVRAQEGNTSVPISVVNSRRATWSASDRASLGVGSLASSQSIVRRRQRGITVQVPVTNTAPAATGDLAIALSVALRFNGSASGYAVQPLSSAIANLPAGQSATLFFSVDALDTAPRGSTAIAAVVSALDAVSLQQVPVANPSSTAWTVQLTGSVTADSLVATAQVLEPGHAGNTVRLALHNPGDLSVDFNAGLRFNHQSAGYLVTTAAGNAVTLAGGASAILTFSVDVLPTAAPGLTTLTADLQANASGAAAAVVNAVQTRWQIQLPAALAVTAIRPGATRLLRGQRQVPVELAIANTAPATSGASAMAIAGTPLFGGSRAGYAVTTLATNVTTLAAGQSRVLTYLVDVLSQAPLGATTLTALVGARDVNTAAAAPVANGITASWTVVGPAELHITRVTPGRAAVTQGEIGLRVEVGIANSGATTAEDLLSDLIIGGNSLGYFILGDPNNAGLLAAGKSAVLTFTVSLSPSVALGPASLVAAVEGLESLQGGPLLVVNDAGAQWTVEAPADLVVLALTVPGAQVVRGERDLPIELLVENAGQTAMEGLSAGLRFNGSTANYAVTAEPANPVTLAAGESRVLTFSVDVLDSAPAGVVSVTSVVLATETHTGRAVPVTNRQAGSWRVLIPATLRLDALALSRTKVSAGQRGLAVRATVVNIGQDDTLSLAAGLRFNGSSEGFDTTTSPGNPTVLAAGQTARLDFTVDVRPDAAPGPTAVSLALSGRDATLGVPAALTGAPAASWTVQTPPRLELAAIAASRLVLAVGEAADITVTLRNSGQAPARLAAVTAISDAAAVLPGTRAVAVADLPSGASLAVRIPLASRSAGTALIATATAEATDANTGQAIGIAANAALPGVTISVGRVPVAAVSATQGVYSVDGAPVPLALDASDSSDPDGGALLYSWRQVDGPSVALSPASTPIQRPVAPGAGAYSFEVTLTSSLGLRTIGRATASVLANSSPSVTIATPGLLLTGEHLRLVAAAADAESDPVTYTWDQVSGASPVELSGGQPTLPGIVAYADKPGFYGVRLRASDPRGGLGSATVLLNVAAAPQVSIPIGAGNNVISVPLSPFTSDGHAYTTADLSRDAGGAVVIRSGPGANGLTRFVSYLPGMSKPVAVEAGLGYVLLASRPATLVLRGRAWPPGTASVIARPAQVLLGYPRGIPKGESADDLLQRARCAFVVRSRVGADGRSKLELYLPGLMPPFSIQPGGGYYFSSGSKSTLQLPDAGGP